MNPGQTVTFRIAANGSAPLTYAWQLNGAPLVNGGNVRGATTALLTLTRVTGANGGIYQVVVSNAIGTATSTPVMLTVQGKK